MNLIHRIVIAILFTTFSFSTTIHVATTGSNDTGDGSENNPYATIQKGVDVASDGDIVSVSEGTYTENINYFGKNISVIGENRENTIIDGSSNNERVVTFENGENTTAVLSGFSIMYGNGGVMVEGSSPKLQNLIISHNQSNNYGGGIYAFQSDDLIIEDCEIFLNFSIGYWGGGIYLNGANADMTNVIIANCYADSGSAIFVEDVTLNISNCTFYADFEYMMSQDIPVLNGNGNILLVYQQDNTIDIINSIVYGFDSNFDGYGNIYEGDYYGYTQNSIVEVSYSLFSYGPDGAGNIDGDPLFCDPENGDYSLAENSPAVGSGEGGVNMGALDVGCEAILTPGTIHVATTGSDDTGDGSENNPYATIQKGVDMSIDGDTVLVASGDYSASSFGYQYLYICTDIFLIGEDRLTTNIVGGTVAIRRLNSDSFPPPAGCPFQENSFLSIENISVFGGIELIEVEEVVLKNIYQTSGKLNYTNDMATTGLSSFTVTNSVFDHFESNHTYIFGLQNGLIENCTFVTTNDFYIDQPPQQVPEGSMIDIVNSIFYGSDILYSEDSDASNINITYSLVPEGNEGEGNLSTDPLLCDPENGDYSLAENSPAVEAGEGGVNMGALDVGCDPIFAAEPCILGVVYVSEGNNNGGFEGEDGGGDYIEIYNSGDTECNLAGFQLDDNVELDDFTFGDFIIEAGGYWIGYEDSDNSFTSGLGSNGDEIVFADPQNNSLVVILEATLEVEIDDEDVILSQSFDANGVGCYTLPTPGEVNSDCITLSTKNDLITPTSFTLHQNYPNPFNPVTTLRYDLPENGFVNITIYDMLGNVVNNLVSTNQSSGYKSIQWNATNNQGQPVSAGVYLYTIEAGEFRQTKKMILLK